MSDVTDVVFLRDTDDVDIFAVFPAELANTYDNCMVCYAHIGQHSSASPAYCAECPEVTDPDEYDDLLKELVQRGYEVCVVSKARIDV